MYYEYTYEIYVCIYIYMRVWYIHMLYIWWCMNRSDSWGRCHTCTWWRWGNKGPPVVIQQVETNMMRTWIKTNMLHANTQTHTHKRTHENYIHICIHVCIYIYAYILSHVGTKGIWLDSYSSKSIFHFNGVGLSGDGLLNTPCRWGSGIPLTDYLPRFLLGGLLMQMLDTRFLMRWSIYPCFNNGVFFKSGLFDDLNLLFY